MGTFIKKTFVLLSLTLAFVVNGYFLWAAQPDWWADYSLIDNSVRQDDAIATVGQAKHVVQKAYQYLEVKLASVGGAGAEVTALYNSYCANAPANPNADLQLLTIGQLKYLAKPFYDRLNSNEVSLDTSTMNPASVDIYPWTSDQMDDADLAFATLGQVKYTFSFDLSSWTAPNPVYTVNFNLDGKGVRTGGGKLVQTIVEGNSATEPAVTGNEGWLFVGWDMAFDNVTSNLTVTAQYGQDTDDDGILDEEELANGLDPLLDDAMKDKDGDGYPNVYELRRGEAGSVNNNELVQCFPYHHPGCNRCGDCRLQHYPCRPINDSLHRFRQS